MSNIEIVPLDTSNIKYMEDLLVERNGTLREYTNWKYCKIYNDRFKGLIAFKGNEPIGCFGSIPKTLIIKGRKLDCGWFADWYVKPAYREIGLGKNLLKTLLNYEDVIFGIPGPKKAQKICKEQDYKEINFQSKQRIVNRKVSYYLKKKTFLNAVKSKIKQKLKFSKPNLVNKLDSDRFSKVENKNLSKAYFLFDDNYEEWLLKQPIEKVFYRNYGIYKKQDCEIKYYDEILQNNLRRRLVLHIDLDHCNNAALFEFYKNTLESGIEFVEFFCTKYEVYKGLKSIGAVEIKTPPILVKGLDLKEIQLEIQPMDIESWVFLKKE